MPDNWEMQIVDADPTDALDSQCQVGQYRFGNLFVEVAEFDLEVLVRLHIDPRAFVLLGKTVEQHGVDIVADAEDEHPRAAAIGLAYVFQNPPIIRDAHRRQPVGEENYHVRSV